LVKSGKVSFDEIIGSSHCFSLKLSYSEGTFNLSNYLALLGIIAANTSKEVKQWILFLTQLLGARQLVWAYSFYF
jgi:hypothetical protein